MSAPEISTLGELRQANYPQLSLRDELRKNLLEKLQGGQTTFEGIVGYEDSVIPQLQNAILAGQDIILLGERGQAKTRIIRSLTTLLDEYIPVLAETEIPENPFAPITTQGKKIVEERGDEAHIRWLHRSERFAEKLATPDITIADLIGEVDPIKVAEGRYLSDELTLHYGMIPQANRGIFAINELPDLSERIQVGLLNVMEEKDVQIRGHNVRLDLDVIIVATANPEDYTNRGRIITPLKDRYGSQIRTHYPANIDDEISIIKQEAHSIVMDDMVNLTPSYMEEIIAEISHIARQSRHISQRSGVSVRASISNYETMLANATRRAIRLGEKEVVARISDLPFLVSSLQGKIEFEIMDEAQESELIEHLIEEAVVKVFDRHFKADELKDLAEAFKQNKSADTGEALHSGFYISLLSELPGLSQAVSEIVQGDNNNLKASAVEFILEGLHLSDKLNKDKLGRGSSFHPGGTMLS